MPYPGVGLFFMEIEFVRNYETWLDLAKHQEDYSKYPISLYCSKKKMRYPQFLWITWWINLPKDPLNTDFY